MDGLLACGVVVVAAGLAAGQVVIGPQQRVDPNNSTNAAVNETSMSVADADPTDLVGGWNDHRTNAWRSFFTLSLDGGTTWSDSVVRPPVGYQSTTVEGDPMVAHDHRDGTLYVGAMSADDNGGIYVARKDPGADTFGPSVMARVSGTVDKGWMCVGPDPADLNDPDRSIVYIAYNQGVSRSSDRGETWRGPVSLGTGTGFLPRVGPSGASYVTYWDFDTGIWIRKSTDGGQSYGAAVLVATRLDVWGIDGTRFPGEFRVPPLASLAVDPVNENLYVVYFDTTQVVGDNRDVDLYFTRSTDGGATWSTPVVINGAKGNARADSFFPWLEVDRSGRIGVVFYDTRNVAQDDTAAHAWIDTYFAYSDDAGVGWHEHRLTPTSWSSQFDGVGWGFIGDYLGMGAAQGATGSYFWPLYLATHGDAPHQYTHRIYLPCPGDFDADEAINTVDVLGFLNAWNVRDPRADINGDGAWNTQDVLAFLNAWNGPCP